MPLLVRTSFRLKSHRELPISWVSTSSHSLNIHSYAPVLKSTGSAFHGYIRDEYTTLVEVDDRILSTSVDLAYTFAPLSLSAPSDAKKIDFTIPEGFAPGSVWDADNVATRARNATLDIFALDESASVQVRHRLLSLCFARC
jgi:urate oxidase